jgi:hypothetical protein
MFKKVQILLIFTALLGTYSVSWADDNRTNSLQMSASYTPVASLKGSIFESLDFDHASSQDGVQVITLRASAVVNKRPSFFASKDFISRDQIATLMPGNAQLTSLARPNTYSAVVPIEGPIPNLTFNVQVEQSEHPAVVTMKSDHYNEALQSSATQISYSPAGCDQTRLDMVGLIVINDSAIRTADLVSFFKGHELIKNQVLNQIRGIVETINKE